MDSDSVMTFSYTPKKMLYVRTTALLRYVCMQAQDEGCFGLDVEFIREQSYVPKLALVQIAVSDTCVIVDPFMVKDLSPLLTLLASPNVLKILHAATQDMDVLSWHSESPPARIFDTQIAAAMVGLGEQLSYTHLVERLLGVTLTRNESYSDWLRRPLTADQHAYALDDVRYLLPLHTLLSERLSTLNRTAWVEEEFRKFECSDRYQRDPRTLFRRIRRGHSLSSQGQAILRELAAWRDQEAQLLDRPPRSVLNDDNLVDIARKVPRTHDELRRLRGIPVRVLERSADALLLMVEQGLAVAEEERPRRLRSSHRPNQTEKLMVKVLDACLKTLCAREKLPASFVMSRSDLEALVRRYHQGCLGVSNNTVLDGWRAELVGRELLAVLEGRLSLALDPHTGEVRLLPISP